MVRVMALPTRMTKQLTVVQLHKLTREHVQITSPKMLREKAKMLKMFSVALRRNSIQRVLEIL